MIISQKVVLPKRALLVCGTCGKTELFPSIAQSYDFPKKCVFCKSPHNLKNTDDK